YFRRSDHPVRSIRGGFATFCLCRGHPSSARRGIGPKTWLIQFIHSFYDRAYSEYLDISLRSPDSALDVGHPGLEVEIQRWMWDIQAWKSRFSVGCGTSRLGSPDSVLDVGHPGLEVEIQRWMWTSRLGSRDSALDVGHPGLEVQIQCWMWDIQAWKSR